MFTLRSQYYGELKIFGKVLGFSQIQEIDFTYEFRILVLGQWISRILDLEAYFKCSHLLKKKNPKPGLEPTTSCSRVECSSNWVIEALTNLYVKVVVYIHVHPKLRISKVFLATRSYVQARKSVILFLFNYNFQFRMFWYVSLPKLSNEPTKIEHSFQ